MIALLSLVGRWLSVALVFGLLLTAGTSHPPAHVPAARSTD